MSTFIWILYYNIWGISSVFFAITGGSGFLSGQIYVLKRGASVIYMYPNARVQSANETQQQAGILFLFREISNAHLHVVASCCFRSKMSISLTTSAVSLSIGRPDARFHDLRHTYAVNAIRAGDDIKTVQGNLGHATAAFTLDVYGHVTAQMKKDSSSRMEAYIKTVLGR